MATTNCCEIHVNDIGVKFLATLKDCSSNVISVSGVKTKTFIFKKPDGTKVEKTPSVIDIGILGQLHYLSESGFLDARGRWNVQGFIKTSGDKEFRTNVYKFNVGGNL